RRHRPGVRLRARPQGGPAGSRGRPRQRIAQQGIEAMIPGSLKPPLCGALLLLLTGCVVSPVPELPPEDVPAEFAGPVMADAPVWPALDWWNSFNDDELSEVIALVQDNNLGLEINERNLEAAQIALREAGFN